MSTLENLRFYQLAPPFSIIKPARSGKTHKKHAFSNRKGVNVNGVRSVESRYKIAKSCIHAIETTLSYVKYKPLTMAPNFMYNKICTFRKDCSLATDFVCSELHVLMEAFLKVAKLTEEGPISALYSNI